MSEHDRLEELGSELPWDRPDDARRDAVRSSLLTAAAETRARRSIGRWIVVGGAFACGAAAAAIAVALWPRPPARDDAQLAHVEASPAAQLERTFTRTATGSDEIVRVHAGRVRLAVGDLPQGDHVRVATADAVVEGAGAYEVAVTGDSLSEVTVHSGTAALHVSGHNAVFLATGQTWRASIVTADLAPAPVSDPSRTSQVPTPPDVATTPPPNGAATSSANGATSSTPDRATISSGRTISPPNRTTTSSPGATTSPPPDATTATNPTTTSSASTTTSSPPATSSGTSPAAPTGADAAISIDSPPKPTSSAGRSQASTEMHLQAGWALLRAGKPAEAAVELGKAAETGDGDLAADARYFQAVALIRAGRTSEAERALVGFLDRAPKSIRRGRASVMLARLLAARGDAKSARAWFESALQDHDPSVVAAARAGLDASH